MEYGTLHICVCVYDHFHTYAWALGSMLVYYTSLILSVQLLDRIYTFMMQILNTFNFDTMLL